MKSIHWLSGAAVALALGGCASSGENSNPQDPWEGFNRGVYQFNDTLDRYALKPVAQGYKAVTPEPVRDSVGNFFSNLGEIRTAFNSVLQWEWGNAGTASGRFVINTILGVGGLLDPATRMGLDENEEDFGQTLAVWGVDSGPYLVLPVLGPSTVRDTSGLPLDIYTYPVTYVEDDKVRYGLTFLRYVDLRASLLDQESLIQGDRYSFIRDAYLQRRQFLISNGKAGKDPFANGDFGNDFKYSEDDFAE
ncbi:VacJ family lipoprotein [Salinicola endophyticus]|uniref:VacJ family lipoprotein n=1 Tax=Salinicola endophyticus TaxID=1949083 RepID=A0ABY8FKC7_9GAMM|nr:MULTISPECIES: VacJ family lipoprotein [Salinicola]WFF43259.1 VacJ family lipoprotein [Salinicola endophyticus]